MLKKLSKSRKKNPTPKLANSRNKQPQQPRKDVKQQKQPKNLNKNNHHSSTLTLLAHHNISHVSHASQSSLLGAAHGQSTQAPQGSHTGDKYGAKKAKSKNRQSSISIIYRQSKDSVVKQKQKDKNKEKDKQRQKQRKNVKDPKKQKSKKNSGLNQNSKNKKNISRVSPQKIQPERQRVNVINRKKPQQEIYQRINLGLFKSKTNSQINFSNNSSVRENNYNNGNLSSHMFADSNQSATMYMNNQQILNRNKKPLTIDCSDEYIISHYVSGSRIKNQDKKRTLAAIKIQKVFRGYLTRKMLQEYIEKQQERLRKLAEKIKKSSIRQSGELSLGKIFENSKISQSVQKSSQHKNIQKSYNRQKQDSRHKRSTDLFFQDHNEKSTNGLKQVQSKHYKSSHQLIVQQQQFYLISLKNSRKQQHPIDHDALQQQSSIYGQAHDSISHYIPNQQKQVINELQDQSQIIQNCHTQQRQCNSRNSSNEKVYRNQQYYTYQQVKQLLTKKQKQKQKQKQQSSDKKSQQLFKCTPAVSSYASRSSRQKIQQPMPTDFSDKKIGEFSSQISSKSRQLQYNQATYNFKAQSGEIVNTYQTQYSGNFPKKKQPFLKNLAMETIQYEQENQLKEQIQNRKKPQNYQTIQKELKEYPSKKQKYMELQQRIIDEQKQKKEISMLKQVQKEKWSKIIQMLNNQIIQNKQKNQENQKFMNIILQFSKKNKEELQKSFNDVLNNIGDHDIDLQNNRANNTKFQQKNIFRKAKNLQNNIFDQKQLYKQINQQSSMRNVEIKRKSNLILFKKPPKSANQGSNNRIIKQQEQQLTLPEPKFNRNSPPQEQESSSFSLYNIKQQSYNISSSVLQDSQQKQEEVQQQQIRQNLKKNFDLPFAKRKIVNLNLNMHNCHAPVHQIPHSYSYSHHHPPSNKENFTLLEKTQQLKNFYRKNHAMYPVQQMIQIRQKALQQRQKHQLNRLNQDLSNNKLDHQQFILRLSQMQQKFQYERQQINKAKLQIFIGYRATHKLMHDSVKDAWYLGFKIPFSQSLKDFKSNNSNNLWIKDIIVDQLKLFSLNHLNSTKGVKKSNIISPQKIKKRAHPFLQISLDNSSQVKQIPDNSLQSISQKTSQLKKQDLSISLPYQQGSHMKQNHEISQQSLYSEDISYNQGEIQFHNLQNANQKVYIFDDEQNQQSSQSSVKNESKIQNQGQQQENEAVKGFRKVQSLKNKPISRMPVKIDMQKQIQTLLTDPNQQQQVQNEIMRKISINPLKKQNREQFELQLNIQNIKKYQFNNNTGADSNTFNKSPRVLYNRNKNQAVKSQIYKVDVDQSSSDEQELIFNQQLDPEIKQITESQIIHLIWEVANQIYMNLHMRSKLCRNKNKMPNKILVEERMELVKILVQQIPSFELLLPRINQKMTASRLELLKFMRVSFQDQDQLDLTSNEEEQSSKSDGFQQIGKFQHILPADICISAMNKCIQIQQTRQQKVSKQINQINEEIVIENIKAALQGKVSAQCIKKVVQRQKLNKHNQAQKNDLRKQIKKVQYHCIFDSLNQILMKKRLRMSGYSGIGLNQLSLVMGSQDCKVIKSESQFKQILDESIKQLQDLVGDEKTSSQKLVMQNYERLCQNDSQWICYTDQALSFALQFVYMLEDQIFFQETAVIFKRIKLR